MLLKAIKYAFFAVLLAIGYRVATFWGVNRYIYSHQPGPCQTVSGIKFGSVDIEVVKSLNAAFITSGLSYMQVRTPEAKGRIYLFRFNQSTDSPKAEPLDIEGNLDFSNFFPHGLSSAVVNGKLQLYVVSHNKKFEHSVEVFQYLASNKLRHLKSIKNKDFARPYNIKALGEDKFLITNDGMAHSALSNIVESIGNLQTGSVVYFDGKMCHYLLKSVRAPSGIATDEALKYLFISSTNDQSVAVYRFPKKLDSGEQLTEVSKIPLHTVPDNLFFEEPDTLWIAAHPILLKFFAYFSNPDDPNVLSPSQVLRIKYKSDFKSWSIKEVFASDGAEISGSSAAILYNKQLLIGSIYRTLLYCQPLYM